MDTPEEQANQTPGDTKTPVSESETVENKTPKEPVERPMPMTTPKCFLPPADTLKGFKAPNKAISQVKWYFIAPKDYAIHTDEESRIFENTTADQIMECFKSAVANEPRSTEIESSPTYGQFKFTTFLFRFVDVLSFEVIPTENPANFTFAIYSISKWAGSDLGVNAGRCKRLLKGTFEALKKLNETPKGGDTVEEEEEGTKSPVSDETVEPTSTASSEE